MSVVTKNMFALLDGAFVCYASSIVADLGSDCRRGWSQTGTGSQHQGSACSSWGQREEAGRQQAHDGWRTRGAQWAVPRTRRRGQARAARRERQRGRVRGSQALCVVTGDRMIPGAHHSELQLTAKRRAGVGLVAVARAGAMAVVVDAAVVALAATARTATLRRVLLTATRRCVVVTSQE